MHVRRYICTHAHTHAHTHTHTHTHTKRLAHSCVMVTYVHMHMYSGKMSIDLISEREETSLYVKTIFIKCSMQQWQQRFFCVYGLLSVGSFISSPILANCKISLLWGARIATKTAKDAHDGMMYPPCLVLARFPLFLLCLCFSEKQMPRNASLAGTLEDVCCACKRWVTHWSFHLAQCM